MIFKCYWLVIFLGLAGCVTHRADHFYTLNAVPDQPSASRSAFARQINLHLTLPSLVDRGELVITSRETAAILEHERWASPLLDQMIATLGLDLESRRADLVVANRSLEQVAVPSSRISIEVVRISAERGGKVSMETRWRVVDSATGVVQVGRDSFSAPMATADYAQLPAALSNCVGQLADKLVSVLPSA